MKAQHWAMENSFERLLPAGVASAEWAGQNDPAPLLPGEQPLVHRAAPERVREFSAGRQCARSAAAQFGVRDVAIGMRADRRPQWPPQLTGSITHTGGFAAAAVAERRCFRAIGIDAEEIGRLEHGLWRHLFLPAETRWLKELPAPEQAAAAALLFSAKEAFYKCQYAVTGRWLEFKDVTVEIMGGNIFAVHPADRVCFEPARGRFAVANGRVLTAVVLATC